MLESRKTKCFAINVKTNINKKIHFQKQAKIINLNFEFFEAVLPKDISAIENNYNPQITKKYYGRSLLKTEMACALSHIKLWQKLQNDDEADYYIIFEDDVFFNSNLSFMFNNKDLDNYDLIRLCGTKIKYNKKIKKIYKEKYLVEFSYGCLTGAAYRISKFATKNLLKYCLNLTQPIDVMMDRSFDHKVINYGILPFPVQTDWHNDMNDPLFTDIGIRDSRWGDSSKFSRFKTKLERLKTSIFKRRDVLKLFFKNPKI